MQEIVGERKEKITLSLELGSSAWSMSISLAQYPAMPRATDCKFGKRTITVADALKLNREERRELVCGECGQRVSPHKRSADGRQEAHFEHLPSDGGRNVKCSRSDPSRS